MGNGNIFQYMIRLEGQEDFVGQAFIARVNTWASTRTFLHVFPSGLTYPLVLKLYQIALGLSYLHREEVIHGDLRSVSST